MTRTTGSLLVTDLAVSLGLGISACSKSGQYGERIPGDMPIVKLKDIASNAKAFKDKEVLLAGNYGGVCCPSDFTYKEGLEGVEVTPKGFASPNVDTGKPMRLYAVVRLGKQGEFFLEAKGVELR